MVSIADLRPQNRSTGWVAQGQREGFIVLVDLIIDDGNVKGLRVRFVVVPIESPTSTGIIFSSNGRSVRGGKIDGHRLIAAAGPDDRNSRLAAVFPNLVAGQVELQFPRCTEIIVGNIDIGQDPAP